MCIYLFIIYIYIIPLEGPWFPHPPPCVSPAGPGVAVASVLLSKRWPKRWPIEASCRRGQG